jgi:hypothetical protein
MKTVSKDDYLKAIAEQRKKQAAGAGQGNVVQPGFRGKLPETGGETVVDLHPNRHAMELDHAVVGEASDAAPHAGKQPARAPVRGDLDLAGSIGAAVAEKAAELGVGNDKPAPANAQGNDASLDAQVDKAFVPFEAGDKKPAQAQPDISAIVAAEVEKAVKVLKDENAKLGEKIATLEIALFSGIEPGKLADAIQYLKQTQGVVKRLDDVDTTLFSGLEEGEQPKIVAQLEEEGGLVAKFDQLEGRSDDLGQVVARVLADIEQHLAEIEGQGRQ